MKRVLSIIIIIVVVAGLLYLGKKFSQRRADEANRSLTSSSESEYVPVVVEEVTNGEIEKTLKYTGSLETEDEVEVIPKISGRLIAVKVEEGDVVRKGQTLAIIDPEITGQRFEPFAVTAPIAGKVAHVYLDPGAFVMQGQPILRIIDDRIVKVRIGILERDYNLVKEGMTARVRLDALPGKVFSAKITNLSPVVDPRTGMASAEIKLDNKDGKLKAGMFARVEVIADIHRNAVLMPTAATLSEIVPARDSTVVTTVYVVEGDEARARTVRLGLRSRGYFEVLEGLKPGEQVVVLGQNLLRDGTKVKIVKERS